MIASPVTLSCQDDPDLFFAPDGGRGPKKRVDDAKALCRLCPIRVACRDEGRRLSAVGIWGGEDDDERAAALAEPETAAEARAADTPTKTATHPRVAACGTRGGYQRHRRLGEAACEPCRIANTQADRRLRSTGSTKVPVTVTAQLIKE